MRETAKAGYLTCLRLWPELLPTSSGGTKASFSLALDPPTELVDAFIRIRPLLTTGWEAVVMLRLLMESASLAEDPEGVAKNIISTWSADACASHLQRWAEDNGAVTQEQVMATFHETRQEWIRRDEAGWIALHNTYPIPMAAFRVLHAEIPAQTYVCACVRACAYLLSLFTGSANKQMHACMHGRRRVTIPWCRAYNILLSLHSLTALLLLSRSTIVSRHV